MARTKRVELTDEIIRRAREFRDACDDGLGLAANTDAYRCWYNLSQALDGYDRLTPDDINTRTHTANTDGPDTEHEAAELFVPLQGSARHKLLMQYRIRAAQWADPYFKMDVVIRAGFDVLNRSIEGLTDSEMEHATKLPHTTVSAARNFLMHAGWIADSGFRRRTPSKRKAIVWSLTPAGLRALDVAAAA